MRRYLNYLAVAILSLAIFVFLIPQARANFIESIDTIIFSLRGVEEEAVNVFVPSPPEPNIVIGNAESEALTAEQVLYEESITALSAVGSCDDSVGEENRAHAERIFNKLNNSDSNIPWYSDQRSQNQSWINNLQASLSAEGDFYKLSFNRPEIDLVYKIYINGNEINLNEYTNASQIIFKSPENIDNLKIVARDNLGGEYESNTVQIDRNVDSSCQNCYEEGNFRLASTGVVPDFTELPQYLVGYFLPTLSDNHESTTTTTVPESTTTTTVPESTTTTTVPERPQAVFDQEFVASDFKINGNIGTLSFSPGVNVKYYKFELNGQVEYSEAASIQIVDAKSNTKTENINIELLNEYGEVGSTFSITINSPLNNQNNSNINFQNKSGYEVFYIDNNEYSNFNFSAGIADIGVVSSTVKFNMNQVPEGYGVVYLVENTPIGMTQWQEVNQETNQNKNISLNIPPSYSGGKLFLKLVKGSQVQSQKIEIPLSNDEIAKLTNISLNNPLFKPELNSTIENFEAYRQEKGGGLLYDLLGPTQVEFGWRPLYGESAYLVRAFNIYINGNCVATQRAWNIIEGDFDTFPTSTIDQITYAIIGRLPPSSDVNVEVRAVGFNNIESEPDVGVFRTYLEPQVSLIDIGVIDTNWIVYNEFAYIYYHISTTKAEYESYLNRGDTFYLQVKMCCNEEGKVYYPTIKFIPVPEYATCSDLTIVGRKSKDNPAFLGIRTNPDLSVTELIKSDSDEELGFESAGGKSGDIIYSINDKEILSEMQLADELNNFVGGDSIDLLVIREGELVLLEVDLTTYPERFNVDEINKATGCFDANGTAIGVFKVKMKEGFSKNQYISSFYFYQRDSTADERYEEEDMVVGGNKEFNRNGNIYSGMGPADSLVSYGLHNINFDKASFTVSTNYKRATAKEKIDIEAIKIAKQEEEERLEKERFIPSESRPEPYFKLASEYSEYEDLQKKEIIPQIKQSSIGDCCYRDNIRSDEGRVFPKGTYSFYFSTKRPRLLEGWDVYSETCSVVLFDLPYDYAMENKNFLRSFYDSENSDYPVAGKITVEKGLECFFDLSEYKQYPYLAFSANTCYVNKEDETFFCLATPYLILPINSWG
mgnify:CR=1 FL=1